MFPFTERKKLQQWKQWQSSAENLIKAPPVWKASKSQFGHTCKHNKERHLLLHTSVATIHTRLSTGLLVSWALLFVCLFFLFCFFFQLATPWRVGHPNMCNDKVRGWSRGWRLLIRTHGTSVQMRSYHITYFMSTAVSPISERWVECRSLKYFHD